MSDKAKVGDGTAPVAVQQADPKVKAEPTPAQGTEAAKKAAAQRKLAAEQRKAKKIQAAKAKQASGRAVPPARAAEKLARSDFPELADTNWVRGNPDAAKTLKP